ncbi:sodium:proton antiporter [Luteococcus sanguinis]|uniref:Sodium:proton antiporter n=1 Tax=Luteococcus sanguinis TaxID=174038 RepID=A0ABW1WXJ0_9ACTN
MLQALGVVPFVALLACIAVLPLVPRAADWWGKPLHQLGVSLLLGLPTAAVLLATGDAAHVASTLHEYVGFIALLSALFVICGGIHLSGDLRATPRNNTAFLALGGVLASVIGTTGASMLLIRPLLSTNSERARRAHTVVFAIFVMANCGGLLTPLGDPPLFLGLLRGVPFLWTLNLFGPWLFVNGVLLVAYYLMDRRLWRDEDAAHREWDETSVEPLKLRGRRQFLLLVGVVLTVALVSSPFREIALVTLGVISWLWGEKQVRHDAGFEWDPILEVAAIFLGIFLTMPAALKVLHHVAPSLPLNEITFFGFTGGLSAFLDNAPTYATFFDLASAMPGEPRVAGVPEVYLVAISLGAVCCGALSYIGNGPNFMIRSVAEAQGTPMPSFGGYLVTALRLLGPVLVSMVLIFLVGATWSIAVGVAVVAVLLALVWRPIGVSSAS